MQEQVEHHVVARSLRHLHRHTVRKNMALAAANWHPSRGVTVEGKGFIAERAETPAQLTSTPPTQVEVIEVVDPENASILWRRRYFVEEPA